jgi:hypothetical protein
MDPKEADDMIRQDSNLSTVLFKVINGEELNRNPIQAPGRSAVFFFDWALSKAEKYGAAFQRVFELVKPERDESTEKAVREKWWLWKRPALEISRRIKGKDRCFVTARTTKHLSFTSMPTDLVFTNATYVFTTDRWDYYAVVQSTIHEVWARKYSGALKQDLRYSPSKCFDTFAFPAGQWQNPNPDLAAIGERYHEHRRDLMLRLWLGLTDIYNLFHAPDLEARIATLYAKRAKSSDWRSELPAEHRPLAGSLTPEEARTGIETLRALHVALDQAVLTAYGWQDLPLAHDFQDVETLPENDRTRYTISPTARKTLLTRLLTLNHQRAAEEAGAQLTQDPATKGIKPNKAQRVKNEDELL